MEEIKDAEVVKETTLIKPELKEEPKAEIKSLGAIEDNIKDLKEYAKSLSDYYKNVTFTPETLKSAKEEKAGVNKFKSKVKEFVKEVETKWNKPLENFKKDVKTTVEILENTYKIINNQVLKYENETKENIKELCIFFFNEYSLSKGVEFLNFEQMNMNITLGLATDKGQLTKKAKDEIALFIDKVVDDINLINSQDNVDEILIEYKKDLNVSKAITEVKNRHIELEKAKEEKENKKEQKLTDEIMLEKINSLSAPVEEKIEVEKQEEILEISFKVRGTREKLKLVKEFLDNGGFDYE